MKIILTQEVSGLGTPGDIVEVKNGYGRNYLLPQGFAIQWTNGAEEIRLEPGDASASISTAGPSHRLITTCL